MRSTESSPGPVALELLDLWVGDLASTKRLLTDAFGFRSREMPVPLGPNEQAVCLGSAEVTLVVREGISATSPVARHVAAHGDTVADVGLVCADPDAVAERAGAYGLTVRVTAGTPTIDLFGDRTVCHTLRPAALGIGPVHPRRGYEARRIDHVAYCLPWGLADSAARAYEWVLGLERVDVGGAETVGGEATGMRSIALRSAGGFTVVLTEPLSQASDGQTQRFVDAHAGAGVQHAALAYDDLFTTVNILRDRGVPFLPFPDAYYHEARQRLPDAQIPWDALHRLGILVDADDRGLLYQLFTTPLTARQTFFLELIQRAGAHGFGANNVKALFAAVHANMDGDH